MEKQIKNELILKYAALAAKNLRENQSNTPTEEMKKISKQLNLSHHSIITSAEILTRPKTK